MDILYQTLFWRAWIIGPPYFGGEIAAPGIAIPSTTRKPPLGDTWLGEVFCNGIKGCWDFSFLEAAWQGSRRRWLTLRHPYT